MTNKHYEKRTATSNDEKQYAYVHAGQEYWFLNTPAGNFIPCIPSLKEEEIKLMSDKLWEKQKPLTPAEITANAQMYVADRQREGQMYTADKQKDAQIGSARLDREGQIESAALNKEGQIYSANVQKKTNILADKTLDMQYLDINEMKAYNVIVNNNLIKPGEFEKLASKANEGDLAAIKDVKTLQKSLKKDGKYTGAIDGVVNDDVKLGVDALISENAVGITCYLEAKGKILTTGGLSPNTGGGVQNDINNNLPPK